MAASGSCFLLFVRTKRKLTGYGIQCRFKIDLKHFLCWFTRRMSKILKFKF